jgi:hypothetical protein
MHLRRRRFVGKNASGDDGSCNLCFLGQCSHIKDCSFFCCATVGTKERAATVIVALATAIVVDVASTAAAVGGVGVAVGVTLDVNAAVGGVGVTRDVNAAVVRVGVALDVNAAVGGIGVALDVNAAVGGVGVAVGADLDVNATIGVRVSVAVAATGVSGTTDLEAYSQHFIFCVTYELFQ